MSSTVNLQQAAQELRELLDKDQYDIYHYEKIAYASEALLRALDESKVGEVKGMQYTRPQDFHATECGFGTLYFSPKESE